jgi:hypothetical protein
MLLMRVVVVGILLVQSVQCFLAPSSSYSTRSSPSSVCLKSSSSPLIDYQSDSPRYGRGDFHLSAYIDEGDVVVYQTGSWLVDGVSVGHAEPELQFARIDNVQLVWTHNCEIGVIRAWELEYQEEEGLFYNREQAVEFGPEQLLARIPVEWTSNDECRSLASLDEAFWSTVQAN